MRKALLICLLIFVANISFAFTFTATPTNETCAGNGSITFNPSNTNPSGSIVYYVYLLPNLTTPYTTVTSNVVTGLPSGTYKIIAKETVGTTVTSQEQQVVIDNQVVPLSYTISSLNQACLTTSNIVVNVTSGNAVSYEIVQGPVTFPLQSSNTFNNLPAGLYKIRVFDNCGAGVVQEFTVTVNAASVNIGAPVLSDTSPPSCNFMNATNTITPSAGTVLGYPIVINYSIHPPNGDPDINSTVTLNTGNPTSQDVTIVVPDYINQTYTYDVTLTDSCLDTYTATFTVDNSINFSNSIVPLDCNENYFTLLANNFSPPYTLNFTNAPAGFIPQIFNPSYPGPFTDNLVQFGNDTLFTPLGDYTVTITDACGRTKTVNFSIIFEPILASGSASNNGCLTNTGTIFITINRSDLLTAIITVAPSTYPSPLPHDVSAQIDSNGNLTLNPVPLGNYTFLLTDKCGTTLLPLDILVPDYVDKGLTYEVRQGCDIGKAAVVVKSLNGNITSISITNGPSSFPFSYPYNGNSNIATADGKFYMNGFPSGLYTFEVTDTCNITNTIQVPITGYLITQNTSSVTENCGAFDLTLNHQSNGIKNVAFWLQKLIDFSTNTWGHPDTGIVYPNGSLPNNTNSLPLNNNATNLNLSYNGTFRIIKTFNSFHNGSELNSGTISDINSLCIEEIPSQFSFNQSLEIVDATRMPCSPTGSLDVVIEALGTLPLHYTIIKKDGAVFFIDNGNSNTFTNLASGEYTFQVEDPCGNIETQVFNVAQLLSLVTITQPNSILQCRSTITNSEIFNLTTQNSTILGTQSPTNYTLTYYESLANAQAGTNAITNLTNYNPPNNPQTIYARLVYNPLPNCYETTSFDLIVGQTPKLLLNSDYVNCSANPVTVDAATGNLGTTTYSWSNGATTPDVTISQIGVTTLNVTATNNYGTNPDGTKLECTNDATITVTISQLPEIDHVETVDWTTNENSITIFTTDNSAYQFSIDGTTYQDENYFDNLVPGVYTAYIKDRLGCGVTEQIVWLLDYPRFFTPNGDGYHDYWRIKNSQYEPHFKVFIYDRYGKLIKYLNPNDRGWDGTYNGEMLFSTDYWFVVYREDGRIHKGHFAMKR